MDANQQLETMIEACRILAGIIKDPTQGGKKEMTAEQRNSAREESYESLIDMLDTIESINDVAHGFISALNIVNTNKDQKTK